MTSCPSIGVAETARAHPLGEPPQRLLRLDAGREHAELLPAPPGDEVVGAGGRLQPAAELDQDPVAREVPVAVVERLEPVDVGHHDADRGALALRAGQLDLVHVEHVPPVGERRERVGAAAPLRLLRRRADVGDVRQDAVDEQPAVGAAQRDELLAHVADMAAGAEPVHVVDGVQPAEPLVGEHLVVRGPVLRMHERPPHRVRRAGRDRSGRQPREPLEPRAFELHLEPIVRVHAEREQPLVDGPGGGLVRGADVGRLARPVRHQPLDGARPPHHREEQRARGGRRQQQHHRRERQHGQEIGAGRGRHRHGHEPGLAEGADGGGCRVLRQAAAPQDGGVAAVRADGDDLGRPRQVGQRARREHVGLEHARDHAARSRRPEHRHDQEHAAATRRAGARLDELRAARRHGPVERHPGRSRFGQVETAVIRGGAGACGVGDRIAIARGIGRRPAAGPRSRP